MSLNWTNWLLPAAMTAIAWTNRRKLMQASRTVEASQLALLRSITASNRETRFGRDHNFSSITDWTTLRENVPVQTHASLEPYITEQIETAQTALVASPLVSLARTSGTTGPTKDIPMTAAGLEIVQDAQRLLALTLYRDTGFFDGRIMALFGSHVEGRLENGLAYGSSSGQANRNTSWLLQSKYVIPREITAISDYDLKYYLYVLFGMLEKNVTGIATANPSSICRLAEIANERREDLMADLTDGDISRHGPLPTPGFAGQFRKACEDCPARVNELVTLLTEAREVRIENLWPNLKAVAVWTGGSCAVALEKLKVNAPSGTRFVELGYRASEFIGSINIDAGRNICIPTLHHTVFEFVEQKTWEAGNADFTPMSKLEPGANYYVFVTTTSGLYRYDVNDVVHVTGTHGSCPSIDFLQKGKGVTSITGEKLYVHQALEAVSGTQGVLGTTLEFCLLLADEATATYTAYIEVIDPDPSLIETFATELDGALMKANIEYSEKRRSGRLKEPQVVLVNPGTGEAIKRHAIAAGQRESQYKPPCLEYASKFDFDLEPWLVPGASR